jgi:hypothetical protein
MQQTTLAMIRGLDLDQYEAIKKDTNLQRKAQEMMDKALKTKNDGNGKQRVIDAYEQILLDKRRKELEKLNQFRFKEIEKNRPPEAGWYMKTTPDFRDELYRNNVSLKPNDTNKNYLKTLKDAYLY